MLKKKKNSYILGFTLLEMLVVTTIFSVIAIGLTSTFISGMKIWKRVKSIDADYNHNLIALEKICAELRESVNLPVIGFEGDSCGVSFSRLERDNSILKVQYKFDAYKKALLRRTVGLKDIIADKEKDNYTEKKVLSLEDFSLEYLSFDSQQQSYIWSSTWLKDKGIFSALRIRIKVKNEEFIKTVFIPIA